jgi:hypothetical protein
MLLPRMKPRACLYIAIIQTREISFTLLLNNTGWLMLCCIKIFFLSFFSFSSLYGQSSEIKTKHLVTKCGARAKDILIFLYDKF